MFDDVWPPKAAAAAAAAAALNEGDEEAGGAASPEAAAEAAAKQKEQKEALKKHMLSTINLLAGRKLRALQNRSPPREGDSAARPAKIARTDD